MNRYTRYALCLGLFGAAPFASADDVTTQIDAGRTSYEKGDLRQAVQELQDAVVQIQQRLNADYTRLMPEPLPGWTAEAAEAQSAGLAMMGGGTQVSRDYFKKDSEETVQVRIVADSPMLQAMAMMLANPMMMQSDPGARLYRHGAHRGVLRHAPDSDQWEIGLLVANRILVQVEGRGLKSQEPVESYLKALDLKAVEQAFSL